MTVQDWLPQMPDLNTQLPPWETMPWPDDGRFVMPYWIYRDARVRAREEERIFARSWNYAGLTAELDNPDGYFVSSCGATPIVITRKPNGALSALVNQCGHRGMELCREPRGRAASFTCPYHNWTFSRDGTLTGIPFRRGHNGYPGLPADFDPAQCGLESLRIAERHGVIFVSRSPQVPDLEAWIGPKMLHWFDRLFPPGKKLVLLSRFPYVQRINANWKVYCENLRDPLHAGFLHEFFRRFRLASAAQPGGVELSDDGRHSVLYHFRDEMPPAAAGAAGLTLRDPRFLELWPEFDGPSTAMLSIGSVAVFGQQNNCLTARRIVPRGEGQFDLEWRPFGYASDSPEMRRHRILQFGLQGPGGYISIDDSWVFEMLQRGFQAAPGSLAVAEMGGRTAEDVSTPITETAIRGFYADYRRAMGF